MLNIPVSFLQLWLILASASLHKLKDQEGIFLKDSTYFKLISLPHYSSLLLQKAYFLNQGRDCKTTFHWSRKKPVRCQVTGLNPTARTLKDPQLDLISFPQKKIFLRKTSLLYKGLVGNKSEVLPLQNIQLKSRFYS